MRKVIVSMNITLDGYLSGPESELDWHFKCWTNEMGEILTKELSRADIILLGRITYQTMARYWTRAAIDFSCAGDQISFAVLMNRYQKAVYSNTLKKTKWNNTNLIKGDIEVEINQLKQSLPGQDKDIIIYGSGKLVYALTQLGLVDEYHLWLHPVILGSGQPLFRELKDKLDLKLLKSISFDSGVVLLHYGVENNKKVQLH